MSDGVPFFLACLGLPANKWVVTAGYDWDPYKLLSFYGLTLAGACKIVFKTSIFVINWGVEIGLRHAGRLAVFSFGGNPCR
jgi:hypothetical protein